VDRTIICDSAIRPPCGARICTVTGNRPVVCAWTGICTRWVSPGWSTTVIWSPLGSVSWPCGTSRTTIFVWYRVPFLTVKTTVPRREGMVTMWPVGGGWMSFNTRCTVWSM
jgi:hypothetical protein